MSSNQGEDEVERTLEGMREELRIRTLEHAMCRRIMEDTATTDDEVELSRLVAAIVQDVIGAGRVTVMALDEMAGHLLEQASVQIAAPYPAAEKRRGTLVRCSSAHCPVMLQEGVGLCPRARLLAQVKGTVSAPISLDGEIQGSLCVWSWEQEFTAPHFGILINSAARELSLAIARSRLRRARAEVEAARQAEELKSQFISMAAHELRTPLTTMMGYSELLLRRQPEHEMRKQWTAHIHKATIRLSTLIDDLLDVSRIQNKQVVVRPRTMRIKDILEDSLVSARSLSEKHTWIIDVPPDLPEVVADHDRLMQVLLNVLSNAIKYSPNGGQITVSCKGQSAHRNVLISVTDEGMGIAQEDMPGLFTTFYRVRREETEGIPGTGLGLYIVKHFVSLMGGEVYVTSELGRGSTFSFTLPLAPNRQLATPC